MSRNGIDTMIPYTGINSGLVVYAGTLWLVWCIWRGLLPVDYATALRLRLCGYARTGRPTLVRTFMEKPRGSLKKWDIKEL